MIRPGIRRLFRLHGRGQRVVDADLDEEIRLHLDLRIEKLQESGMSADEAREEAMRRFGPLDEARRELRREATRRESRLRLRERIGAIAQDVRLAVRGIRRTPGYALLAVFTLALGIGVTTAAFSLANWILLRPVPGVAEPDRLVIMQMREGFQGTGLSYANFEDLGSEIPAISSMAGYAHVGVQGGPVGVKPEVIGAVAVTGDYFDVLGMRPVIGRFPTAEEASVGGSVQVAVVSTRIWRSMFGGDRDVIGEELSLNGTDFTVIGVAPEGFHGTSRLGGTDVWVPAPAYAPLRHLPDSIMGERSAGTFMEFVARLAPGAEASMAETQLRTRMAGLVAAYPDANEIYKTNIPTIFEGIGLDVRRREGAAKMLSLMMGLGLVLLLIACSNVANLLLLRGIHRRGETAVRRALGASGGRILQTHLVEGVLLALAGGVLGAGISLLVLELFRSDSFMRLPPFEGVILDWRVLSFALALSLVIGVAFGLIPAWVAQREEYLANLKDAPRTRTGGTTTLRRALSIAQIAAAMVLLIGAGLLARTLHTLSEVDLGFDEDVLTFGVDAGNLGFTADHNTALRYALLERVREIPGIERVAVASSAPFTGVITGFNLRLPNEDNAVARQAWQYSVSEGYFATMGIPLMQGRAPLNPGELVVSEPFSRMMFGDASPIGRQLVEPVYGGTTNSYTIVGLVDGIRIRSLRESEDPVVYRSIESVPAWQSETTILVQSRLPRAQTEALVAEAVAEVEPQLAFYTVATISDGVKQAIGEERLLGRLVSLLALLAAFLAAIGLYAVVSYAAAQRTREIGIRIALGAPIRAVIRLVAREAGVLALLGIGIGVVGAVWLTQLVESRLFGVERLDPATYLMATAVFLLAVAAATWRPVRAALRTDPVESLRHE
ncbi:MAG TPA: ADOP family duplicated permease [Longimicrobiaceae bacterium]|nr:ADOP family duplicated permease [Longimicrobiaceae bacterium]